MLAGPGTGKTHALVDLYEQAVRGGLAARAEILVLTFSTGAAAELAKRIDERLNDDYGEAWISTFHSFCRRVLRDHAPDRERLQLSGFQEWLVMRRVLAEIDAEALGALSGLRHSEAFAHDLLTFVALMKQNLVHPAAVLLGAEATGTERLRSLAAVYQAYQRRLEAARMVDFRDLVSGAVGLLQSNAGVRDGMRSKFKLILVDEFQDVDPAQFELLRLIAPPEARPRLVVVGDPDQSIYGFRGTVPHLLSTEFVTVYGATTRHLEDCRRCSQEALDAGERLLAATQPGRPARSLRASAPTRNPLWWWRARATWSTRPSLSRARSSVCSSRRRACAMATSRWCSAARPRWEPRSRRRCARSRSRTRCEGPARRHATRWCASSSDTSSRSAGPTTRTRSKGRWLRALAAWGPAR